MEFYGTIDSLLEYAPPKLPEHFANQDVPDGKQVDSLEELLMGKVRSLSDILHQIDHDIESRKGLSLKVVYYIYQHYSYLKTKLFELYTWGIGRNRDVEMRRSKLEKQLDSLKQEKRQDQVRCWQDITSLRKEFRDWFKQYCDLVQHVKLILPNKPSKHILNFSIWPKTLNITSAYL